MTWIRIDDNLPDHPKVIGLPDNAFRLYISLLCYSSRYLTDGFIALAAADKLGHDGVFQELTAASLICPTDNGWHIKNYDEYQSTKAEVDVIKERNRSRTARWREKNKGNAGVTRNIDVSNSDVTDPPTPTPIHTPTPKYSHQPIHKELAEYLAHRITENGSKPPTVSDTWINDIRLMVERDNRTIEEIRYMIDWCQDDSFWRSNILSPSKLRAKFDQLRLNAEKQSVRKVPQGEAFLKEFLSAATTGAMQKEIE
jgi:hypothetical protein